MRKRTNSVPKINDSEKRNPDRSLGRLPGHEPPVWCRFLAVLANA
jgi:hypothetical protein